MGYGGTNMYGFLLGTLNSLPKIGMLSKPIPCECRTGAKENDQGYVIDRYSLKVSGYSLKNFDGKTNITIYPMKTLQWLETNYGSEAVSQ